MESAGLFLDDYPNNFTSDNGTVSFISSTFGVTSSVSSSLSSSLSSISPVSSTASASIDSTLAGSTYPGSLDALGSNLASTLQPDALFTLVDSSLDQPPCSPAALLELKLRNDPLMLLSVISLVIINLAVIAGNILVIVAVTISSKLRTITNFFIVSLAVADLLLGLTVAPYALALTVLDVWIFGEIWCLGWLVIDVWLSTASILNLCAISVDRYLAVTRPVRYRTMMTSKRAKMIIAFVWILSFIVSFPPLLGWNDTGSIIAQGQHDNDSSKMMVATTYDGSKCYWKPNQCVLFDNTGYVTYSALGSFYIPMSFMMFFYWRIYIVASRTTRALKRGYKTTKTGDSETDGSSDKRLTLRMHRGYICEDTGSNASSETPSLMSSLSTDVHNCHQLHPIHGHSHAHHHSLHHSHPHSHAQPHHHSSHHDYTNNHNHQVNCTSFMKTSPKLAKSFFNPSKLQGYNNRVDDNNNSPSEMSNISNVNNNNNFNNLNDTNNSHSNNSSNNSGSTNINSCESHFGNNLVVPKFTPGSANAGGGSGSGGSKGRRKTPITVYRSPRLQVNSMALEGTGSCCEADGQKRRSTCSLASTCSGLTSFTGIESSPSHTRDSGRSNASKSVRFSRRANTGKWQTRRLLAETKAAKTVGIIVGGFIICWFPFFTIYLIRGYCRDQNCVPKLLLTIFTWLGYTNSAVNPIIYGLFSRDFRRAFKNIICKCKYSEETGVTSLIRQIHLPNLFEEDNHDDCMKTDSQEDVH